MAYEPFGGANGATTGDSNDAGNNAATDAAFLRLDSGSGGNSGGSERDARGDEFDATIHVGRDKLNADGSFRKKRGRRAGSGDGNSASSGSRRKADNQASVEALSRMLAIVHIGLSSATKTPELTLTDDEAATIAKPLLQVADEFNIRPDPKVEAIFGLIVACGSVYGPKAYFIRERWKDEAKAKVQ